jgi:hypothetical protein
LATTLPATYAGIETKIHTITNTTAISSKVSRSIPFENRDASAESILGLFSAVSYNISVQLMVRFRIATLFGLFLTGTFFEEVFYRGYLTERMTVLTKHRWAIAFGFGIKLYRCCC